MRTRLRTCASGACGKRSGGMEAATHVSAASIPWRSPTRETSWGLNRQRWSMQRDSYQQAGVDIADGDRAVDLMRKAVAGTVTPGVLGDIGGFGGCFQPNLG